MAADETVRPSWPVEVTAEDDTDRVLRYQLEYGPFGGRLVEAMRQ